MVSRNGSHRTSLDRYGGQEHKRDPEHQHTPAWDESLVAQMRYELDAFVVEVHFGGERTG